MNHSTCNRLRPRVGSLDRLIRGCRRVTARLAFGTGRSRGARHLWALAILAVGWSGLTAHVGSETVIFEGEAGSYPLRVIVRPPPAIPGLAEITVRVRGGGVGRVTVQPVRWDLGTEGAPRPDEAVRLPGEPDAWTAQLWLMEFGSYSVHVAVEGEDGAGRVIVPVPARATAIADMPVPLQLALIGLGLFLAVGLLSIVGAAAREASLPPGVEPGDRQRRRSRTAQIASVPILALVLFGGARWWASEERAYESNLYVPFSVETEIRSAPDGSGRSLVLEITDPRWTGGRFTPLLPDHGKLMHLFLVGTGDSPAMAHLHPERVGQARFATAAPPLSAGEYLVFADILHESGFTQTLTDTIVVPNREVRSAVGDDEIATAGVSGVPTAEPDPDDSWTDGTETFAGAGETAQLSDGSSMRWTGVTALRAGEESTLTFDVFAEDGSPATLEPYMGMAAHAVIARDDGAVFVHLHPLGTVSMTSQQVFERRASGDIDLTSVMPSQEPSHTAHTQVQSTVSFPYEFPDPGNYRIWVQVSRDGRILTGSFGPFLVD